MEAIVKRLSKYTSDQLLKKYESKSFSSPEEESIVKDLLIKRGKLATEVAISEGSEPLEEIEAKELTITELIDAIYEINDKTLNKKLCSLFPTEGVDDYSELPVETVEAVRSLYNNHINPPVETEEKPVKKAKATPLKAVEQEKIEGSGSKSDIIRRLFDEGKSVSDISKETSFRYQYVYNVTSKYKQSK